MNAPIDFWFDFTSPYSYLAAEQIDALAAKYGRTVGILGDLQGRGAKWVINTGRDLAGLRAFDGGGEIGRSMGSGGRAGGVGTRLSIRATVPAPIWIVASARARARSPVPPKKTRSKDMGCLPVT